MYFDITYVILVLPAVILSLIASLRVNSTFKKYSSVPSSRGITAREAAERVLEENGVSDVRIERVSGSLTDHYDPRSRVIRLSDTVYDSTSVAAIGVACHEAGHAAQYADGYLPVKIRAAIIPVTNIGSKLAVPLIILGLIFSYMSQVFTTVAYVGVALFGLCVVFQLITLPTEFNASRRAMKAVSGGLLTADEAAGARRVLTAAAMTYVAALAVSVMQLLRLVLLVSGSSRKR